jgi:serine/threonine protein kinase/WD40 repeat protein
MLPPHDKTWSRVEEIRAAIVKLTPEEAARYLRNLEEKGEPVTVLSLVGDLMALPPLPAPLGKGDVIAGEFLLDEPLGEGGMGSVWRATQQGIGREVALKLIHPALVSPAMQARFADEREILGKLEHPGIVEIFTTGLYAREDSTIPFFAMKLVEGVTLARWAEAHRHDRAALLRMMSGICEAVQHAHDRKVVHRDLKPSNVMVAANGRPVVLDFGIARLAREAIEQESGGFSGSLDYAAPEQHLCCDQDFGSGSGVDIYAAGAILFEMLSGRRLFLWAENSSFLERRQQIIDGRTQRLSAVLPDCPPLLEEIVMRAVHREPLERFTSIAALSRALNRAVRSLYGPPKPPPPPWLPEAGLTVPETEWKLTEKLGEGSTGQVWLAANESLGEERVFKFCDSEEKIRNLKRELTLFRLLKHRVGQNPHFIPLHEVSLEEPPWYLQMDHVDALDLESWCARQAGGIKSVTVEERVEIVAQAAEALQAAHDAGILHRDLKPANILIRATAPLHVFISDFGIGHLAAEELVRTAAAARTFTFTLQDIQHTQTLSGTMFYLAPELMAGTPATARSDIYSLGVVLWQLLVGDLHAPLDPTHWAAKVTDPLLREDLMRCLTGQPEHRWPSAGGLAASLRSLESRRLAEARQREEMNRRVRAAYRRGIWRTAAIAALVLIGVAALAWYAWAKAIEAERQREAAAEGRAKATLAEFQGMIALKALDGHQRLFQAMPALELSDAETVRQFRTAAISILSQPSFEPLEPGNLTLNDGDWLAEWGERALLAEGTNGLPAVMDLGSAAPRRDVLAGAKPGMHHLRVNARGRIAGGVDVDGSLHLWSDIDSFGTKPVSHRVIAGPVHAGCFAISPTTLSRSASHAVAMARPDGSVEVLLRGKISSEPVRLMRDSSGSKEAFPETFPATMLAFCSEPEGILAMAGPDSNLLLFWKIQDSADGKLSSEFAGCLWHPDAIRCIKWSPRGRDIATGAEDGIVRIWRYVQSNHIPRDEPEAKMDFGEPIRDLAWTIDGELIAVLLQSGGIRLIGAQAPDSPLPYNFNHPEAKQIGFLGSDTLLTWGGGQTRRWGQREAHFRQKAISVREAYVNYHQEGCLTASARDGISFLIPSSLAWCGGFKADSTSPTAWLKDSLIFQRAAAWRRAETRPMLNPQRLQLGANTNLDFSRCVVSLLGRRGAFWGDRHLECREIAEGSKTSREQRVALADEPLLLAASDAGPVTAWVKGAVLNIHHHGAGTTVTHSGPGIVSMAFSPTTGVLACRTESGVIFASADVSHTEFCPVAAPSAGTTPIAFSSDGNWLAVCGPNQQLMLGAVPSTGPGLSGWPQLKTVFAEPVILQRPSPKRIVSLAWNSSGSHLTCGTGDGFVQSWNLSLLRRTLRLWRLDWSNAAIPDPPSFIPITLN